MQQSVTKILLLLATVASAATGAATPRRRSCSEFADCKSCATNLSWLGTPCRWCPIDRKCHEVGSVVNRCSDGHNIVDPSLCPEGERDRGKFDKNLSFLSAALSGAAYAPDPAVCLGNFRSDERLSEVTRAVENCDLWKDQCVAFVGRLAQRKLIVLSFRGTKSNTQLFTEGLMSLAMPKNSWPIGGKVQSYFNSGFSLLWQRLRTATRELIRQFADHQILVTGHSLGGALAALAAVTLAADEGVPAEKLLFYSFGEPRVGNYDFSVVFDELVPHSWRVVHGNDVVVHLPSCSPVAMQQQQQLKRIGAAAAVQHSTVDNSAYSCTSHLGFPYHHGTEIFFPTKSHMTENSEEFRLCDGPPTNEDATCANNASTWRHCFNPVHLNDCVHSHVIYYGIHLGKWWDTNQCGGLTDPTVVGGGGGADGLGFRQYLKSRESLLTL